MNLKKSVTLLVLILFCTCVAAELNWKDTLKVGQAKLYQKDDKAYSVELVHATANSARFYINGEELTPVIYEDDEYETADGSTIQPTTFTDADRGRTTVEYYFYASESDMIQMDDSHAYRSKFTDSSFDYDKLYTDEEYDALMKGYDVPENKVSIKNITEFVDRYENEEVHFEVKEEKQIFSIGWMNKFANWIKGLFS